jgi:hypothetical protein
MPEYHVYAHEVPDHVVPLIANFFTNHGLRFGVQAYPGIPEANAAQTTTEPMTGDPIQEKPHGGHTLVGIILRHSCQEGGLSRGELECLASTYHFSLGSISPTLVKLMKQKRIKRIGKGVYARTAKK